MISRMLTVVPERRFNVKDDPAGTVNPFTSMVVHFTAVDTSDSEDIVPVQSLERVCRPGAAYTVWNTARTIENQALVLAIMNGGRRASYRPREDIYVRLLYAI